MEYILFSAKYQGEYSHIHFLPLIICKAFGADLKPKMTFRNKKLKIINMIFNLLFIPLPIIDFTMLYKIQYHMNNTYEDM